MPLKPELNVSGYRGIWGETLTDEIVTNYSRAFAMFIKEDSKKENPTILIGRDGRESGPEIRKVIMRELQKIAVNVIDGDIMPTPTVLFSVRKHKYDGAIIITASHNPIEYNGLKFINKEALFTMEEEIEKIKKYSIIENSNTISPTNKNSILSPMNIPNFTKEHADEILAHINIEAIRNKKFKVAVDMINASACVMDPYLFEQLGVKLIPLNNIPNGKFTHKPEPLRENLNDIANLVKESGADLGFVHDPDADRLVIVNEKGEVILEEYSVVFGIENILSKNPGKTAVINLSTSQMSVDIAKKYNSKTILAKVGEPNVVKEIISHNAIIGGEGNGGVIYPTVNLVRDSFVGLSLVLELLAERNQTISECIKTFPKYFMQKDKWSIAGQDLKSIILKLKTHFKEAQTIEIDGIRLDFADHSWLHLHPSNTEPIVRLFGEAKTEERIKALFSEAKLTLGEK